MAKVKSTKIGSTQVRFLKEVLYPAMGKKGYPELLKDCEALGINITTVNSVQTTVSNIKGALVASGQKAIWEKIQPVAGARGRRAGVKQDIGDLLADLENLADTVDGEEMTGSESESETPAAE